MEPIYVKSRWPQKIPDPKVANYLKMLKSKNVKPLKKDLGLVHTGVRAGWALHVQGQLARFLACVDREIKL